MKRKGMNKKIIQEEISDFVKKYPERGATETRWKAPIVGFASADDPLFVRLKEVVRPTHALPRDLLPNGNTVIAYFLPFGEETEEDNSYEEEKPSRSWAIAYIETNRLIKEIGHQLKALFEKHGYTAISTPVTHNYDQKTLVSDWSHRHVSYIAGLGKFGLNRWLITEQGCCGRLGSMVTDLYLAPSPRPRWDFCLHFAGYHCSVCLSKCKPAALTADQFDRDLCNQVLWKNDAYFPDLQGMSDVCGKCGCGVPCSRTNPVRQKQASKVFVHPC
jgi:epoxyqueuosine reductase QueG